MIYYREYIRSLSAPIMRKISASKFKEQCLSLLERVPEEGIAILKYGKPVARLMPIVDSHASWIGKFKERIVVKGDITTTGVKWNAES